MAHDLSLDVLKKIRQEGTVTRAGLAKFLGVSLSLVSRITTELLDLGLIDEKSTPKTAPGRPADALVLNSSVGYVAGLDIAGESQVGVVTNLAGDIIASAIEPGQDGDLSIPSAEALLQKVIDRSGIATEKIFGLGVGVRHIVDPVTGMAYTYTDTQSSEVTLPMLHHPVRDELAAHLSIPHLLVDDIVRALGTAEVWYGLGSGETNFIYLLDDTGIGMAIMLDGVPFIGASHIAGEIAHVPVPGQNTLCGCGNRGCLGTLTSIPHVLRQVEDLLATSPVRSNLRSLKTLTIDAVIEMGERGDKAATQVLSEAGNHLGSALAVVLNLFGPRVVIGGGKLLHSTIFREAAGWWMRRRALEMAAQNVELKLSPLDELAGARGAATLAINALFEPGDKDILHLSRPSKA